MNDLDLRTALHRDADLVGEPPADLLDRLARRRQHQRRQRTALISAAAAVVVVAAGIPVGASFLTRSHVAPATQTTSPTPSATTEAAPTTSAAPTTTAAPSASTEPTQSAASSASPPLVASWSRQTLFDLSFVVPVDPRVTGVTNINPPAYSAYDWNEGVPTVKADPPVHFSVTTSATDNPPDRSVPDANRETLTVPGAADAWVTHEHAPPGTFPGDYENYFVDILTSSPRFYMVHIQVPATGEGAAVAQTFVHSLRLVTPGS